jgi:hypothetical protein
MQSACAVSSSVACRATPHFSTLYHKRQDFRKNVIEHKMCSLIFSTTFVWNISHFKKNSARYNHRFRKVKEWTSVDLPPPPLPKKYYTLASQRDCLALVICRNSSRLSSEKKSDAQVNLLGNNPKGIRHGTQSAQLIKVIESLSLSNSLTSDSYCN